MEEPLPAGGSCLLGSINLSAYVSNGRFDIKEFRKDIPTIVKGMNDVLDQGLPLHPLQIQKDCVRDWRQIGVGIMGIADMLIKLGLKYDTEEAIALCDAIGFELANGVIKSSALLAKEYGVYPKYDKRVLETEFFLANTTEETRALVEQYGLRNSQLLTIAPTGTLSTMLGISGGIEPIFNLSYTRKTESLHGEEVFYKVFTPIVKTYMEQHGLTEEEELPEQFVTAQTLNPFMRVKMQGAWQKHIDASISSTVNLPESATIEDVEELYIEAWKEGLKGLTIFRDNCKRLAVLINKPSDEEVEEVSEGNLKRGEWEQKPKGCIEIPRKIYSGCGKELLHITIHPQQKRIIDFYITSSSAGGCKLNIQGIAIAMSGMLRVGASLDNIKCAYRGMGNCPSFASAKAKGKHCSKGNSCPMAILNVLLQVQEDLENECLEELQELGYYEYNNVVKVVKEEDIEVVEEEKEEVIYGLIERLKELEEEERREALREELFTKEELDFIREYGEVDFAKRYNKCPNCKEELTHTGGCINCTSCGFSKCD